MNVKNPLFLIHANTSRVPVVGLADFNPHGYEILEVYRRGSANSMHAGGCYSGMLTE